MAKDAKQTEAEEEKVVTTTGPAKRKDRTVESAATAPAPEPAAPKAETAKKKDRVVTAVTDGPEHVSPELTDIAKEKEAKRKDRVLYGTLMVNGKDPR